MIKNVTLFLAIFFTCISIDVHARSVEELPEGTDFILTQSIEIPPQAKAIYFQRGSLFFNHSELSPDFPYCLLTPIGAPSTAPIVLPENQKLELSHAKNAPWGRFFDIGRNRTRPELYQMVYRAFPFERLHFFENKTTAKPLQCFRSPIPEYQNFPFEIPTLWITDFVNHQEEYKAALSEVAAKSVRHMTFLSVEDISQVLGNHLQIEISTSPSGPFIR